MKPRELAAFEAHIQPGNLKTASNVLVQQSSGALADIQQALARLRANFFEDKVAQAAGPGGLEMKAVVPVRNFQISSW